MKTLKELKDHGINFLTGYTEALKDIVDLIMNPEVYDPYHTSVLMKYIDNYVIGLLEEEGIHENSTANR